MIELNCAGWNMGHALGIARAMSLFSLLFVFSCSGQSDFTEEDLGSSALEVKGSGTGESETEANPGKTTRAKSCTERCRDAGHENPSWCGYSCDCEAAGYNRVYCEANNPYIDLRPSPPSPPLFPFDPVTDRMK